MEVLAFSLNCIRWKIEVLLLRESDYILSDRQRNPKTTVDLSEKSGREVPGKEEKRFQLTRQEPHTELEESLLRRMAALSMGYWTPSTDKLLMYCPSTSLIVLSASSQYRSKCSFSRPTTLMPGPLSRERLLLYLPTVLTVFKGF